MTPFEFASPTRIVFGPGRLAELGSLASQFGRRALVVSDPGIVAAGHVGRAVDSLRAAGLESRVFDQAAENPTSADVDHGVAVAGEFQPDLLIGLGGGSSLDCAKGINFVHTGGGRMQDYWGLGKATRPMLPMIAVPTTAGTGSESQSFALISDPVTHVKMACGDKKAACRIALLDPELTLTQPGRVTALTGIDALAHAVETFVTTKRNAMSLAFSREAWRLIYHNLPRVFREPTNLAARAGVQLGACFAGLSIENSMLGAAHALANPLTAQHGVAHGAAVGLMLPHVVRFNGETCGGWYDELTLHSDRGDWLAGFIAELAAEGGLPSRLRDHGVARDALPTLAAEAAKQWTGTFNPRPVTEPELLRLYESAY